MTAAAARIRQVRLSEVHAKREDGADGTIYVRSTDPLGPYARRLTNSLAHWADATPDRIFMADRTADGGWRTISFSAFAQQIRPIAQALIDAGLSPERPLAILSGAEIEHALMGFAAMLVGIPCARFRPPTRCSRATSAS